MPESTQSSKQAARQQAFIIVNGSEVRMIPVSGIKIGRNAENDLILDSMNISRNHASIEYDLGVYVLNDLKSTGGTSVNGAPVGQHVLSHGDVIALAGIPLIFGLGEAGKAINAAEILEQADSKKSSRPTEAVDSELEPASIDQFIELFDNGEEQHDG
jgi:pSer/pThr/pTyr-binding forkhead associated (FHA) protein